MADVNEMVEAMDELARMIRPFRWPLIIESRTRASRILHSPSRGGALRHVISIGDPDHDLPSGFGAHPARKLRLTFDDIERPSPSCSWYVPCTWAHVRSIVAFAAGIDGPTLIHCAAGISRSTAAGLIVLAHHYGPGHEERAVDHLVEVRPQARPNRRMVWMADALLGRDGALIAAHRARWTMADEPEVPADG